MFTRRALLAGASLFVISQSAAARDIKGAIFWKADLSTLPLDTAQTRNFSQIKNELSSPRQSTG